MHALPKIWQEKWVKKIYVPTGDTGQTPPLSAAINNSGFDTTCN